MKLDRNINPNGRGKYALINLRKLHPDTADDLVSRIVEGARLPSAAVETGGPPEQQFFVIKYKDRFAAPALRAYAAAVREYAALQGDDKRRADFIEYADEIEREAEAAQGVKNKQTPD